MNIYNAMNATKHLLQLKKTDMSFKVDSTAVSVSVTTKLFKKVVLQQIEEFDKQFRSWLEQQSLSSDEFDDILVAGGVANCNLVYDYLQKTFPHTVF